MTILGSTTEGRHGRYAGGAGRNLIPRSSSVYCATARGACPSALWALYIEPVIGIVAVAVTMTTFVAVGRIAQTAPNDFTVFLESARWLRQGADMYQPPLRPGPGYNLNPPAAVLLFVPFSFLQTGSRCTCGRRSRSRPTCSPYWIAREVAPKRMVSIAGAIFLFQPLIMSLLLGQIGGVMMLLVTAAWIADRRDRPLLAGVLLGIAIGAKPFLLVFAAYAVWRRSVALGAGLAAGVAAMVALGLMAAGVAGFQSWLGAIERITWGAHVANASLFALLTRTLSTTPAILHATPVLVWPELVHPLWWTHCHCLRRVGGRAAVDAEQGQGMGDLADRLSARVAAWLGVLATMFVGPLPAVARAASRPVQFLIAAGCACLNVPPTNTSSLGAFGVLFLDPFTPGDSSCCSPASRSRASTAGCCRTRHRPRTSRRRRDAGRRRAPLRRQSPPAGRRAGRVSPIRRTRRRQRHPRPRHSASRRSPLPSGLLIARRFDLRQFHGLEQAGRRDDGAGYSCDQRFFVEIAGEIPVGDVQRHCNSTKPAIRGEAVAHPGEHGAEKARPKLPAMRLVEHGGRAHLPRRRQAAARIRSSATRRTIGDPSSDASAAAD